MKKILFTIALALLTGSVMAQTPEEKAAAKAAKLSFRLMAVLFGNNQNTAVSHIHFFGNHLHEHCRFSCSRFPCNHLQHGYSSCTLI